MHQADKSNKGRDSWLGRGSPEKNSNLLFQLTLWYIFECLLKVNIKHIIIMFMEL